MDPMYKIGEALIGDGPELAHIDLLIGDKQGQDQLVKLSLMVYQIFL